MLDACILKQCVFSLFYTVSTTWYLGAGVKIIPVGNYLQSVYMTTTGLTGPEGLSMACYTLGVDVKKALNNTLWARVSKIVYFEGQTTGRELRNATCVSERSER